MNDVINIFYLVATPQKLFLRFVLLNEGRKYELYFSSNGVNLEYEVKRSSHRDIIASMKIKNIIMRSNFDIYIYIYAAMFLVSIMSRSNIRIIYIYAHQYQKKYCIWFPCLCMTAVLFAKNKSIKISVNLKKDQRGNND